MIESGRDKEIMFSKFWCNWSEREIDKMKQKQGYPDRQAND